MPGRQTTIVLLLCALTLTAQGCRKRGVKAAPPPVAPAPAPEPAPPKPAPPQISPRLSREEQAAAERQTQQAISEAEKNLQAAYGKKLNDAHQDLVEKIRGFLGQAREAMRAADWVRARNLAQKAQVLSV